MGEAGLYAVVTALAGVILFLGWLYATTDNPRSATILLKSVALFVVPVALLGLFPEDLFRFPLSMWVVVLLEECLKALGAKTEQTAINRFLLVVLFGIWELVWVKPLWGLNHSVVLDGWNNLQLAGLTAGGIVTVLMHAVTAEIYAFRFGRVAVALIASWAPSYELQ